MNERLETRKNEGGRYSLKGHWLWGVLTFLILLLIDLCTKIGAQIYFEQMPDSPLYVDIIPNGVMGLTMTYNPGIAFSGFGDAETSVKLLIVIGTAVMMGTLAVLYFKLDKRRTFLRWCFVFVVAGGVGNLIDRVVYRMWAEDGGGVRDMVLIDFSVVWEELFHTAPTDFLDFGVCNFADFFIVGGAVALVLAFLFFDTDAFFPVGKYKALAEEAEQRAQAKEAAKKEKAANAARKGT